MALPDFQKTLFETGLENASHGLREIYRGNNLSKINSQLLDSGKIGRYSPLPKEVKIGTFQQELPQLTTIFSDHRNGTLYRYLLETTDTSTVNETGITTNLQTLRITRLLKEETLENMLNKRANYQQKFNKLRSSLHIIDLQRTGEFIEGAGPKILFSERTIYTQGRTSGSKDHFLNRVGIFIGSMLPTT